LSQVAITITTLAARGSDRFKRPQQNDRRHRAIRQMSSLALCPAKRHVAGLQPFLENGTAPTAQLAAASLTSPRGPRRRVIAQGHGRASSAAVRLVLEGDRDRCGFAGSPAMPAFETGQKDRPTPRSQTSRRERHRAGAARPGLDVVDMGRRSIEKGNRIPAARSMINARKSEIEKHL